LKSGAFWSGNSAHDQNDRIIYNEDNGYLYYDPDGTGSASQKAIAKLSKNLEITHKDFFVV
jgi:predicted transcriptional regulator